MNVFPLGRAVASTSGDRPQPTSGGAKDVGRARNPGWIMTSVLLAAVVLASWLWIPDPIFARAAVIAGLCIVLWLTEVVPPYVPTLLIWALTPLLLTGYGEQFQLTRVLAWSANPVLALFLGGFALSVAASRHGIDNLIARLAIRFSGGHRLGLVALVMAVTALLSMWMSNIAAAAMMLVVLHPLFADLEKSDGFRRATLIAIAIGANFGGIATPIGTGPNAIAIAAVSSSTPITFVEWMIFAVPLAVGLMIAGGIALGTLLDQSGLPRFASAVVPWQEIPPIVRLFTLCMSAAMLSALMSNTAAVTMLIPLAAAIDPAPSTAILIAISASLGIPFVISTPPNAMVYGEGGVTFGDLAVPGLILMILGCVLVTATGPSVLHLVGIP